MLKVSTPSPLGTVTRTSTVRFTRFTSHPFRAIFNTGGKGSRSSPPVHSNNFMKLFLILVSLPVAATAAFIAGVNFASPTFKTHDNGLMTNVPSVGYSRVETVNMCLQDAGVKVYQDLTTDMQFVTFNACLQENT